MRHDISCQGFAPEKYESTEGTLIISIERRNIRTSSMWKLVVQRGNIRQGKDVREDSPDSRVLHVEIRLSLNELGVWDIVEL